MTIQRKMLVIAILPLAVALILGFVIFITSERVNRVTESARFAEAMSKEMFELNILAQEYLQYMEERPRIQLKWKHESIENLLGGMAIEGPEQMDIRRALKRSHKGIGNAFARLASGHGDQQMVGAEISSELRERIKAEIMLKSQAMVSDAERLSRASNTELLRIQRISTTVVIAAVVVLVVALASISHSVGTNIAKSISKLQRGTEIISNGNLEYRIGAKGTDEIAHLSRAFDRMTTSLGVSRDQLAKEVIERTRAEEETQQLNMELERRVIDRTTQLEAVNKELEAFSYSVSHDLRAPLRSIDGFSMALLEDCVDKLDTNERRHLDRIRAASQRMGKLIDDLLRLSRLSRNSMEQGEVDLSAIANEIASELHETQPERNVTIRIAPQITAEGDSQLLRVVLENLFTNAWKYTGKHTHAAIEFGTVIKDSDLIYYVQDDGAGFDMEYADKLFGAFQRLHSADEFPGTGIGLATAQRIIRRHGGRIWAESVPEKGSTFFFTLGRG